MRRWCFFGVHGDQLRVLKYFIVHYTLFLIVVRVKLPSFLLCVKNCEIKKNLMLEPEYDPGASRT